MSDLGYFSTQPSGRTHALNMAEADVGEGLDPNTPYYLPVNFKCPRCQVGTAVSTGHLTVRASTGLGVSHPDFTRLKAYRCTNCHTQTYCVDPERAVMP